MDNKYFVGSIKIVERGDITVIGRLLSDKESYGLKNVYKCYPLRVPLSELDAVYKYLYHSLTAGDTATFISKQSYDDYKKDLNTLIKEAIGDAKPVMVDIATYEPTMELSLIPEWR